jgi:hypothetical protein
MRDHAHALIAAAAQKLAGRAHAQEGLHDALFTLVRLCLMPERQDVVPVRRTRIAGEVLPPQQRASWARARTPYDAPDAENPQRSR